MGHGLVEGLQALQCVGPVLGGVAQVLVEAPVARNPGGIIFLLEPVGEVGADQGVGIDLLDGAAGTLEGDQPVVLGQADECPVPVRRSLIGSSQGLGQAGDGRVGPQGVQQVPTRRAVEEAEQAQDGELAATPGSLWWSNQCS